MQPTKAANVLGINIKWDSNTLIKIHEFPVTSEGGQGSFNTTDNSKINFLQ